MVMVLILLTATTSDLTQTPTNIDTYESSSSTVRTTLVEIVKLNADKIIKGRRLCISELTNKY